MKHLLNFERDFLFAFQKPDPDKVTFKNKNNLWIIILDVESGLFLFLAKVKN